MSSKRNEIFKEGNICESCGVKKTELTVYSYTHTCVCNRNIIIEHYFCCNCCKNKNIIANVVVNGIASNYHVS